MEYSWWRELPAPHLRLFQSAMIEDDFFGVVDVNPMDVLVLGTSDEDLADITAISVDICLGGIEVTYGHRPIRKVGTRFQAMKRLSIDGRGGERIVLASITVHNESHSLTIITNRGRCLAIGNLWSNSAHHSMEISSDLSKLALCGFYGLWMKFSVQDWKRLRGIGFVGSVNLGYTDPGPLPTVPKDANNFTWEPSMLPPNLRESGPVWGSHDHASIQLPKASVVSRIDCSRPLKEVRVTITHSRSNAEMAPITAITFEYTDGSEESVGPGRFLEDATCTGCGDGGGGIEEELSQVPHYRHETWKVDGKRLTSLKIWRHSIWLHRFMSVAAIQFMAEGQRESPVCGYWRYNTNRLEPSEIRFAGEGGGTAVGLKMFFGKPLQGSYRDGDIIVGIQELVPADSYAVEVRPHDKSKRQKTTHGGPLFH